MEIKEKSVLISNENQIVEILNNGDFGSLHLKFENEIVKNLFLHAVKCYDIINKGSVYSKEAVHSTAIDNWDEKKQKYNTTWVSEKIEGVFTLFFTRDYVNDQISIEDLKIEESAKNCLDSESNILLKINPRLMPEAKSVAKRLGLKIVLLDYDFYFHRPSKFTIYEKIKDAYNNGDMRIYFSKNQTSINTIRAYCTTFKKEMSVNVSCDFIGEEIVVFLRPHSLSDMYEIDFFEKLLHFNSHMTKEKAIEVIRIISNQFGLSSETKSEPEEDKYWLKEGFTTEELYQKHIDSVFDEEEKNVKERNEQRDAEFNDNEEF